MPERFVEYYERFGPEAVARAVTSVTGIRRTPGAVRQWMHHVRAGRSLPEWLPPRLPEIYRTLDTMIGEERGV